LLLDLTIFSLENPFPAGLEDCQQALMWAIEHAGKLGIDARRVAIGGACAGGGLAAAQIPVLLSSDLACFD